MKENHPVVNLIRQLLNGGENVRYSGSFDELDEFLATIRLRMFFSETDAQRDEALRGFADAAGKHLDHHAVQALLKPFLDNLAEGYTPDQAFRCTFSLPAQKKPTKNFQENAVMTDIAAVRRLNPDLTKDMAVFKQVAHKHKMTVSAVKKIYQRAKHRYAL